MDDDLTDDFVAFIGVALDGDSSSSAESSVAFEAVLGGSAADALLLVSADPFAADVLAGAFLVVFSPQNPHALDDSALSSSSSKSMRASSLTGFAASGSGSGSGSGLSTSTSGSGSLV